MSEILLAIRAERFQQLGVGNQASHCEYGRTRPAHNQARRLRIVREFPSVREDLTEGSVGFVQPNNLARRLDQLQWNGQKIRGGNAGRQTVRSGNPRSLNSSMGVLSASQIPDRSGFPLDERGAGAARFGLPSGVRGVPQPLCASASWRAGENEKQPKRLGLHDASMPFARRRKNSK